MPTPDNAMAIGRSIYLFYPHAPTSKCLISAHGGAEREQHFTVPPGVTIHFYAWHGYSLKDPGLALVRTQAKPKESITGPQKCHDYLLSKYQGSHNKAGETYENVSDAVSRDSRDWVATRRKVKETQNAVQRQMLQKKMEYSTPYYVATIRKRAVQSEVRLSYLIQQVSHAVPMITEFHCSFCRSSPHPAADMSVAAGE